ncbi:MAG TPA: hypothetical protein VN715_11240 [Roseiarcus sp.]|nr:hypothetical protein [Roseiarcus sp.]
MLPLTLADTLTTRARAALPALRRASALAAPVTRHPQFGAFALLAAVALGGAMMMANMALQHHVAPMAAARLVAPLPVRAALSAPPKLDPIAVIAAPSPALPKVAEKMTQRIDTTPTASIAKEEPVQPKRRLRHTHKHKHVAHKR